MYEYECGCFESDEGGVEFPASEADEVGDEGYEGGEAAVVHRV